MDRMTDAHALLDGLDDAQASAVTALSGPVRITAGAGAGKTRTITRRIAYACATGAWDPRRALAVTFSRDAANQLRNRLASLGVSTVQTRTFHSAALSQLRMVWRSVCSDPFPRIEADSPQILAEAIHAVTGRGDLEPSDVRRVADEISWAKVSLVAPADYERVCRAIARTPPLDCDADMFARVFDEYDRLKGAAGIMDFTDILLLDCHVLERFDKAAQRIRSRIGVITVDEYQDVSPLQHRLLMLWLDGSREICVVGDSAQTIYSFAGATNYYLRDFAREFSPVRRDIVLNKDYRSTGRIVHYANRILAASPVSDRYLTLESAREEGAGIRPTRYETDRDEAASIARTVHRLIERGVKPRDIGILARTNAQLVPIRAALLECDVPVGGRRQPVVLTDSDIARAEDIPDDISDEELAAIAGEIPDTPPEVPHVMPSDAVVRSQASDDTVPSHRAGENPTLVMDSSAAAAVQAARDGTVTVSTIHAAKGLEWEYVFVAGCSDGLIPYGLQPQGEKREEERRLMYVAATRAMTRLFVSYAIHPSDQMRSVTRTLSPFLRDR